MQATVVSTLWCAPTQTDLWRLLVDCLQGLAALEAHGQEHRDIKPDNLLVFVHPATHALSCKVGDWGTAKAHAGPAAVQTRLGSSYYCAPEMRARVPVYTSLVDVYSIGVSAAEAVVGVTSQWYSGSGDCARRYPDPLALVDQACTRLQVCTPVSCSYAPATLEK